MSRSTSKAFAWWGGWTGQRRHENGFRLNAMDLLLASVSIITTYAFLIAVIPLWWAPVYLFATFFIFCNVLRITRRYELIWCAGFIATCLVAISLAPAIACAIIPATGFVIQLGLAGMAWRAGDLRGFRDPKGR